MTADDRQALDALRKAVAEALERKRRLGQDAAIWRDGQVVRIEGDELKVPSLAAEASSGTATIHE